MTCIEHILTEAAVLQLERALKEASDPSDFLGRADVVTSDPSHLLKLEVPFKFADPLAVKREGVSIDESANIATVFEGIGEIGRDRASDRRLWNYCSFVAFRAYMEDRWAPKTVGNWKNATRSRWLVVNPSRNTLMRHGIARLWWVAQLTYDRGLPEPYTYTNLVAEKEDRMQAVLDRQIGSLSNVTRAVLDYASCSDESGHEKRIRYVMKSLTAMYGYRDLARLSEKDIATLLSTIEANKPANVP